MRIWKFPLVVTDRQSVLMPAGANLLDVQMQGDECCLWALCDEKAPLSTRHLAMYGTGNPMPDNPGKYVATFQMRGGSLVFHAFESPDLTYTGH
ncbi:hypothetical protein C8R31_101667 [Nitrosospira sp. Nsp2]|uniref:DUF7352 domain-containing protein n=1 Tax=Nitrosospira sp. Nsp2 TaxID=136548 RepID=UPI000D30F34B|nr:hypothetical protein [Nitrosospira sp. Nsp2]PTR17503.1 hypothetical protein C8R31_101667 [Nitrosospira sp. Nsp2]